MTNSEEIKTVYLPDTLTDDQKDAVVAGGEVIVSAAAGSGKTSTMINRILRLIFDGIDVKDMLILVYNNAAADELREKLHRALYSAACTLDGEAQNILKKQLDELSFAHISTIHAYCQSLIKENFNYLGISPTFEVLDEDAHKEYMATALDNVFDEYDKEGDEAFEKIVEVFSKKRKEDNLKDNIIKLFQVIDIQPNKSVFFDNVRACYTDYDHSKFLRIILDWEHDFFGRAKACLKPCLDVFTAGVREKPIYAKYLDKIVNAYTLAGRMTEISDFDEMCLAASTFADVTANKSTKWDEIFVAYAQIAKACIDDMKEEIAHLKEFAGKEKDLRTAHDSTRVLIDKFIEITNRFADELARLKREDNVLAFEDLQHGAVELLSREDIKLRKFKQVFVDEYQDVNPTQEYIISKLVDGNCFMVGDTKQSIYAFRLADPGNFSARQARYEAGEGTAIRFNRNFRSARQILEFVNSVFDFAMTKDVADVDYKEDARFDLTDVKDDGIAELHLFYSEADAKEAVSGVYDITADEGKETSFASADLEGIFVANKIHELVGRAKKDEGYISYGDVTIITRNRSTNAQRIVARLKDAGIPVDDSGFEKSKAEPERELIQFLRVIDNPRQDIPLVGFLLSFFGGYTEQELATISGVEAPTFYDKLLIYASGEDALAQKIKATQDVLARYRTKASFKNVRDLASGIVADFSYDAYLGKNGEADVHGLKAFIGGIPDKDNASLGKFLKGYGESTSKKSAGTKSDRVHLSTFHGYKGLENEVVFVCDLDANFSLNDVKGDLIVDGKGYIAMNDFDFDKNIKSDKTISKFATRKLYDKKTLGEEMRLLYVALTRAKRYMYATSSVSKKKLETFGVVKGISAPSSMLDIIGDSIADGGKIAFTVHGREEFEGVQTKKQSYVFPPANKTLKAEIEMAQAFEYPHAKETKLAIKYSVSALDSLDEQTVSAYAEGDFKNIGTIYHKVMQYIDFSACGTDGVKNEIARLVQEKYLTEQEVEEARAVDGENFEKKIATCLASEIIRKAYEAEKAGKCFREKSFMMYKPAREVSDDFDTDEKVLVQGVIDLYICGEKKIIVDFKNSNLKDEESLKKYEKQLKLYKMAVESADNVKIDSILLYSFKTGNIKEFKV